ncbi:MAG: glycosyltransferase family 2 protein [Bacilli bacterium]|nr:glycosyltransferase family 2 protein [Bacilli bacterium]
MVSSRSTNSNDNAKVLFIIPAYNEENNIDKVLKEIEADANFADVVVINDCSTDNTKQVVLKHSNVVVIDNIFNLKYAGAVQTGLKYAYQNDYDYVIQFDADGQHIAKEAIKLLNKAKTTDNDIIIGSRYLEDLGYPCPFFRRIGTKIFSGLITMFCNKKIADPLSGFQCLNKKVIYRYAKMGGYPEFPDANLVIEMLLNGYKFIEVPTKMRLREEGESMHGGIIKPIKYMINMFYTIFFILIQNINYRRGSK